tara:strand:- start:158 stop:958 length:801 start_codon:yes stop_codon:yes gene_type:complete
VLGQRRRRAARLRQQGQQGRLGGRDGTALGTVNLNASAIAIAAGRAHNCAILFGGDVKCWGYGSGGQLGYDSNDNKGDAEGDMARLGTVNLNASAIAITAGYYHTCAILVGGSVKCWGRNEHGQLGYDSEDSKGGAEGEMAALGTVNLNASAIAITAGGDHTCAILVGGSVKCWGDGDSGRLGYDSKDNKGNTAGDMARLGTVAVGASVETCLLEPSPPHSKVTLSVTLSVTPSSWCNGLHSPKEGVTPSFWWKIGGYTLFGEKRV